ncbi:MAG: phosphocholine cytidylyltransferase family protein [Rhodospirillales bacterium]|nr:phosphocholine cytidylyltransferase family protein [Alphaproteobacteria bacterium]MBL6948496.1 phosphocholine cytidylyltransferase family protein [Rhodospirillales bacterium]
MKVIMLAAGVGRRLYGDENDHLPKALLRFGGKTLLARHLEILGEHGIDEMTIVVGHRKDDLLTEAEAVVNALGMGEGFLKSIFNPRYEESALLSLWTADAVMRSGDDVLFMDADVLYHPELMGRLMRSEHRNCFTMDREFEMDDEPVKIYLRGGEMYDFGKQMVNGYEGIAEWPGFMRMSPEIAVKVADAVQVHIDNDTELATYETAMRDVLVSEPAGTFGYEDITGIPWTEIDFPEDVTRAEEIIFPQMEEFEPVSRASGE